MGFDRFGLHTDYCVRKVGCVLQHCDGLLGVLGVLGVLGGLGVLGAILGDLKLLLRQQGSAPLQYNSVYWWKYIFAKGQSNICVLFHKMKWSFPR